MQDHEPCTYPLLLHTLASTTESDRTIESPPHAPNSPSHTSDLDFPMAFRKEPRNYPSTRYPLNHLCACTTLSTDHRAFTTSLDNYSVPKNVIDALQHLRWFSAMQEEMPALWKKETWDLCSLPPGKHTVGCKWVFTEKVHPNRSLHRLKAQLVVKGYFQSYGVDYDGTFSPVTKMAFVCICIDLAATGH